MLSRRWEGQEPLYWTMLRLESVGGIVKLQSFCRWTLLGRQILRLFNICLLADITLYEAPSLMPLLLSQIHEEMQKFVCLLRLWL